MINLFFKTSYKCDIIKHITKHENWFNWSFHNGKAFFRVETNNDLCLVSKIVEFDFDLSTQRLSNPKSFSYKIIPPKNQIISYEDPRYYNGNLTYTHIYRNSETGHIEDSRFCINGKELGSLEKNWFFWNQDEYIYSICPFKYFNNKKIFSLEYRMPEWENLIALEERFGLKYSISTNSFDVNDRQFILFHTKKLDKTGCLNYYQGVIELKDKIPYSYSVEPLFYPSKQNVNMDYHYKMVNFRQLDHIEFVKYNLFYAMSAQCINNLVYIAGGLDECQSVLYSINKADFLTWYNNNAKLINE